MVDSISTALSGVAAAQTRINVAANNTANADTPGFKAQQVKQSANAAGGVRTEVVDKIPATVISFDAQGNAQELPNTSPEEELVNAQIAKYDAQANIQIIKKQKELDKRLLDIQA